MRFVLVCLLVLGVPTLGLPASRFVDKDSLGGTCSNSNPGTQTQPRCSIAAGAALLVAGDTLSIRAGTYTEHLDNIFPSGSSDSVQTIIQNFGSEVVTIRPPDLGTDDCGICFDNDSFITFRGIKVNAADVENCAISLSGTSHHVTVENIMIEGVHAPRFVTNGGAAICMGTSTNAITVRGNTIQNFGVADDRVHGIYPKGTNHIIEDNIILGSPGYGIHFFTNTNPATVLAGGVVRGNYIANSTHTGILLSGNNSIAYNNVIVGSQRRAINAAIGTNLRVLNNTLYNNGDDNGDGVIRFGPSSVNGKARNNILFPFVGTTIVVFGAGTFVTTPNWTSGDPQFESVNTSSSQFLRLKANSLAINVGSNLSGEGFSTDRVGTARGSSWDYGAYEFVAAGANPTITIQSPTTSTSHTTATQTVTVSGIASDPDGTGTLQNVTFTCQSQTQGGTCSPSSGPANGTAAVWNLPTLTLSANSTAIVMVTVTDATGRQGTDSLTITFPLQPVTAYVSTDGNDTTGTGTQGNPWRTFTKAAAMVPAGSTVKILAGTYVERVAFTISGTSTQRITFEGELATDGTPLTVIDGSSPTSGWVAAPEIGSGVWKTTTTTLGFTPASATAGGKTVWKIGAHAWTSGAAQQALTWSTTQQVDGVAAWDGIEALFGVNGSTVYMRFRDGASPATKNVRMAPAGGTLTLNNVDYITIKDMQVQGGAFQVNVTGGSTNITIENNVLRDGNRQVVVDTAGPTTILRNDILHDDLGAQTYLPGDINDWDYTGQVNNHRYFTNKFLIGNTEVDQANVFLHNSTSTLLSSNVIEKGVAGVAWYGPSTADVVTNNLIQNFSDNGLYAPEANSNVQVHNNTLINCQHLIRIDRSDRDRNWDIYNNRFFQKHWAGKSADGAAKHLYVAPPQGSTTGPVHLRIYHNTFAGGGWAIDFGSDGQALTYPNILITNNFRTTHGWTSFGTITYGEFTNNQVDATGLWDVTTPPDFRLPVGHSARDTAPSLIPRAWPGMTAAYYVDGLPDYGSRQGSAAAPPVATSLRFLQVPASGFATQVLGPVSVEVLDHLGLRYTAAPVTVTLQLSVPAGALLSGTGCSANVCTKPTASGVVTWDDLRIDTEGAYTLTASASGLAQPTTQSQAVTIQPLPPVATRLAIVEQPTTGRTNVVLTPALRLRVLDQEDNPFVANSVSVTVTKATGSGTLGGTLTGQTSNGEVTFATLTLNAASTYTLTASFTTGTSDDVTTGSIVVTADPPAAASLRFSSIPASVHEDTPFPTTVQVVDQYGADFDPAPEVQVTITKTAGSGTLTGGGAVTTVAGLATFSALQLDTQPTTVTLQASSSGLTAALAQVAVGPTPLVPAKLAFGAQPANTYAGYTLVPVTVRLLTAQDALVVDDSTTQVTLTLTDNTEGATVAGDLQVAVSAGIATFGDLSILLPGTYTLTATSGALTSAVSQTFRIDVAPLPQPVLKWTFDAGSGTLVSDTGVVPGRFPGTISNLNGWIAGQHQPNALRFTDAEGDEVRNTSFSWNAGSPITVTAWVRLPAFPTGGQQWGFFHAGPSDPGGNVGTTLFGAYLVGNGTALKWHYGSITDGGVLVWAWPADGALLNQWVHLALVSSGTSGQFKGIYVNGQLQVQATGVTASAAPTVPVTGLRLGWHQPYGTFWEGTFDLESFAIYDSMLTAQQVQTEMAAAAPPGIVDGASPAGMLFGTRP